MRGKLPRGNQLLLRQLVSADNQFAVENAALVHGDGAGVNSSFQHPFC